MGREQDLILAVRNQDINFLHKHLIKGGRSTTRGKHRSSSKRLNVNFQDGDGMSGLHQAALMGLTEIMELLLDNGASVALKDNKGMLALHYAAWQGKQEPVHILLQWKSPCNEQSLSGETALHLACQHGHFDVVNLLLLHQASPIILNKDKKSPLDLACEFGRYRVVDLLLRSNLCSPLLVESPSDMSDNKSTCIHLAAKNGHSDIIRLLLQAGVNINRSTLQGTCLHESALFGKTDVVRLLLDCGVDVNRVNSYDQTALDIVNKFTTSRASKEIKQLLKEASFSVQAKAIKDYCNIYDPNSLTFREGDIIKIVEQRQDGFWRGSLMKDGCMAKLGWFPADHVVLIDNNDENNRNLPVSPQPAPPSYQTVVNNTPQHQQQHINGRVIVNHIGEHCYVDNIEPAYQNSWDMSSASPGGSNRNSAASSDSGRGLSTNFLDPKVHHNYVNVHVNNHHRLSATSYESGVSSRQSYHSTSSSSVGSLDRLEESGYSSQVNVAELYQAGVPDHEVLRAWLSDLRYEEYYQNFMQAGYDMPTITHMTPQDLTAIGISKPGHRKKLKAEIARLNLHDGIPDFKPTDVYNWLRMLGLEQYFNTLANQGYDNIDYVIDITWEDLEEIGIQKLGHQKKIMLAIDRLKRIMSGTKRLSTLDGREPQEALEPPMACISWSGERSSPPPPAPPQYNELPPYLKPRRSSSGDSLSTSSSGDRSLHQPLESEYANTSSMQANKPPAVVPIKVKRSMSQSTPNGISESKDEGHQKMCQSFHAPNDRNSDYSDRENTPTGDDSDMMSRSPMAIAPVAPRVKPKPVAKIVAKQSSREGSPDVNIEKHEAERNNDGYKSPIQNLEGFKYPLATNGSLKRRTSEHVYDTPQLGPPRAVSNYVNYSPMSMQQIATSMGSPIHVNTHFSYPPQAMGSPSKSSQNSPGGRSKKAPPPPPKRTASIRTSDPGRSYEAMSETIATTSSSPMSSVLTPPPIQHKPQFSSPQAQAFVNCVQSLSERFGKKSEQNDACDNLSSDGEDLPPPPPPVAMDIITPKISNYGLLAKGDKHTSGEYMLQQRLKREGSASASNANNGTESAFGVKLRQAQTEANAQPTISESVSANESACVSQAANIQVTAANTVNAQNCVRDGASDNYNGTKPPVSQASESADKQRKDSTGSSGSGSGDISSSTTSLDSNTLPFANENVGTIKQRAQTTKPSLVMVLDDGRQSSVQGTDTVFSETNSDTLKRAPNKMPKPQSQVVQMLQRQPDFNQQQQQHQRQPQPSLVSGQTQPSYNASVTASYLPGTQVMASAQSAKPVTSPKPAVKPAVSPKPQRGVTAAAGAAATTAVGGNKKSGDVLSEIDNMLQGLTDELDAMLEFEMEET